METISDIPLRKSFKLAILIISLFCILGFVAPASAETSATQIAKPVMLPNSPLYFLKDIGREIQYLFVLDPTKKAELRLEFANQKLVEIKKLAESDPTNTKAIDKAFDGYEKETQKMKEAASVLKKDSVASTELLNKITEQNFNHQQILNSLAPVIDKSKVESAQVKSIENFAVTSYGIASPEKVKETIGNNLNQTANSAATQIEKIDVINKIDKVVPEDLKKDVVAMQSSLTTQVGQSLTLNEEEQIKLSQYLEEIKSKPEYKEVALDDLAQQIIDKTPEVVQKFNALSEIDKEKLTTFSEEILKDKNINFEDALKKFNSLNLSSETKQTINQVADQVIKDQIAPSSNSAGGTSIAASNTNNSQLIGMANPASVFCEKQGYKLEIRKDAQGNEYGMCIFGDGKECDEWKFYRNECGQK